jgi:hypothetical protein
MVMESGFRLPSGSPLEEILMSGLGEGPQQFGVHRYSLDNKKKYGSGV